MLTVLGQEQSPFCDGVSRRSFLRIGALGMGGVSFPRLLEAEASARSTRAPVDQRTGKSTGKSQKSVIMVYLPGGPPHLDMYDLKPDAPAEVRGSFRPIETNVPGTRICELLPSMARIMDKVVLVRSVVGGKNRHESFQCYTGRPGGRPGDPDPPGGWPSFGSVVSRLQGYRPNGMPPYMDVGPHMGYGPYNNKSEHDNAPSTWPGFLGVTHTPFHLEGQGKDDLILSGITHRRLENRKALLSSIAQFQRSVDASGFTDGLDTFRQQALGLLTSSKLAEALDLEREDPRVRERYGKGGPTTASFGAAPKSPQHLLLARRLAEAGVPCITVAFGAWDWHANRGGPLAKLAREDLPMFDHTIATFVEDLDQRGMLDDVLVVVWGEFGRTPRINRKGGRDHWPKVSNALLAGGGMRGGQVIGATTSFGDEAKDRPVHFQEIFATIYTHLGLDIDTATVTDLSGRPHYLVDHGYRPLPELAM